MPRGKKAAKTEMLPRTPVETRDNPFDYRTFFNRGKLDLEVTDPTNPLYDPNYHYRWVKKSSNKVSKWARVGFRPVKGDDEIQTKSGQTLKADKLFPDVILDELKTVENVFQIGDTILYRIPMTRWSQYKQAYRDYLASRNKREEEAVKEADERLKVEHGIDSSELMQMMTREVELE